MSKELEIRRQFLDEAQEYLEALDTAVIGLSSGRFDIQRINSALRAAHSIKGGAGMMGFQWLSQFAHRLEDSFKVLKTQSQSLAIDAALENLLLSGINCLRMTIQQHQQDQPIEPTWVEQAVEPIFQALHDQLGDPPDEDAVSVLATESGQDVVGLLFETEVEGCLQRLETVLANPEQPCLQAELTILAQELGGLGEMLQLTAFTELCSSIEQSANIATTEIGAIAEAALTTWRHSQSLVLAGHLDALPNALPVEFINLPVSTVEPASTIADAPTSAPDWIDIASTNIDLLETEHHNLELTDITSSTELDLDSINVEFDQIELTQAELAEGEWIETQSTQKSESTEVSSAQSPTDTQPTDARSPNFQYEVKAATSATSATDNHHATVRVAVRQLNQLNDLFGELTIERNGLDLYLKRLRNLSRLLTQRLRLLEQFNAQLRSTYDRIIPHTIGATFPLLPPAADSIPQAVYHNSPISNNHDFDLLELDRYSELHLLSQQVMETIVQVQEVSTDIDLSLDDAEQTSRELNKTAKQLQTYLTQIRMRPLADIVDRFPRALREWCLQYNKQVTLTVKGGNTLIERSILEALNDPLMHLLRNAFDHGIETPEMRRSQGKPEIGTIEITATHRGNRTVITLSDDGRGISLDKIRQKAEQMGLDRSLLATASEEDLLSLIFEPGFSTRDRVTDLSGRGVGLDVVRDSLRQIRGEIGVNTSADTGTTFTLSVPFTLSVVRVLLVESNGMLLAFPTDAIRETLLLTEQSFEDGNLIWQEQLLKCVDLSQWLTFNCPHQPMSLETAPSIDLPTALIVTHGSQMVGIRVDRTWAEQEVAIRRTEGNLAMPEGFVGCAIVADGRVVPLVNVTEMLDWIISCEQDSHRQSGLSSVTLPDRLLYLGRHLSSTFQDSEAENRRTILIIDDSINIRRFLALTLERAGYSVEQAKDGLDALDKLQKGVAVQAVICDIEMPRLDGFGFLTKFKSNPMFESIPVTMLTSRTGEKHRQLALSLGAAAYFSKPYNEQELLQVLEKLIAQNHANTLDHVPGLR
ncbi:MAG: hybrid sensor histidine kinase/response regulator [Leptolyngbyaceae cyanobacterium bins.302]|nr:hybrid sensor histidine kinase/response regulator [Leptolyngbyaceae cyanobacterium bins.302]